MRMHAAEIHNFVKSFTTHDSSFKQVVHALCQYRQPKQTKHNLYIIQTKAVVERQC